MRTDSLYTKLARALAVRLYRRGNVPLWLKKILPVPVVLRARINSQLINSNHANGSDGSKHQWLSLGFVVMIVFSHSYISAGGISDLDYGRYGAEYLKLPRHAQTAGLGNATVAWTEDMAGMQYNPAVLASNKSHYFMGSHSSMTLDRSIIGMAYHTPALYKGFVFALEGGAMGVKDFEGIDENKVRTGKFDDQEGFVEFSTAAKIPGLLDYGVRLRYLYQQIGDWDDGSAHGFGLDLGLIYSMSNRLKVGMSAQSLGSVLHWGTGRTDPVVPQLRMGINHILVPKVLQWEVDLLKPWAQPIEGLVGVQGTLLGILSLRTGLQSPVQWTADGMNDLEPEWYAGVGVRSFHFGVDYSYARPWSVFGASHKISILVSYPLKLVEF